MSTYFTPIVADFSQLKSKLQTTFLSEFKDLMDQKGTHDYADMLPDRLRSIKVFNWIESVCPVVTVKFFVTKAKSFGGIHIDGNLHDFPFKRCALNIPLFNCDSGVQVWYQDRSDPEGLTRLIKEHRKGYNFYLAPDSLDQTNWEPVETMPPLNEVRLVKTDSWHNVDNRTNPSHRVVASLRFVDNPEYDSLVSGFAINKFSNESTS